MNKKVLLTISGFLLTVLILVMGIATFVEKAKGTDYAYVHFYGTTWFVALWACLAGISCIVLINKKLYRNIPVFLLHLSLLVILLGAGITRLTSENGSIHLREQLKMNYYRDESGEIKLFPFSLQLSSFQIKYYQGTQSPSDYVSIVQIADNQQKETFDYIISMNNILSYKGYRFYQSSFDEDLKGSVLTLSRDVYGIPITYCGYFLLFLSMLWVLLSPKGRFRALLRSPLLKKSVFTGFLLFFLLPASKANDIENNSHSSLEKLNVTTLSKDRVTLNREQAAHLGKVWVLYNQRIVPLQTLSIDFTKKLIGKESYKYANAEQVFAGWLFFPEKWQHVRLFKVENPELRKLLSLKEEKACFTDFFDDQRNYKLAPYYKEIYKQTKQTPFEKEALQLNEKIQLINMLHEGELLKIFPYKEENSIRWYSPMGSLSKQIPHNEALFIRNFFALYYEAVLTGNTNEANILINKLQHFQQQQAATVLPSPFHQKVELLSNRIPVFSYLFKINLGLGFLAFLFFVWQTVKNKQSKGFSRLVFVLLLPAFLAHTAAYAARWHIGGYFPVSNGFETMLFIAWCAMLLALILQRYSTVIPVFGLLVSGFALLVAHIAGMNPQITPLVPVLSSPLLSVHVSLIMFSYAIVGFLMLNSLMFFCLCFFSGKNVTTTIQIQEKLFLLSRILLYPMVFLLGAGIFVGAIWANVSWGRYWGWDPKEVWALITFLVASLLLHGKICKSFGNPFFFNSYIFFIFALVLMTYFGVNYFLGGLHSYAGNATFGAGFYSILIGFLILALMIIFAYHKYKKYKIESIVINEFDGDTD